MEQVAAVAYYTVRELLRRKLLIFLVAGGAALVLAVGILAAVIKANAPAGTLQTNDFAGLVLIQMANLVGLFAWISAIAISVTLINHDLDIGSAVSIFSKPISRLQYALGKMLAASLTLLLIVLILGIGTQLVVLVNGGGHEAALFKTFLLIAANVLTQAMIILVLSVLMNNIVAAGLGVGIVLVGKVVGGIHIVLHALIEQSVGAAGNLPAFSTAVDIVYWLVPRNLDSDLTREVFATAATPTTNGALSTINVSGPIDVAYWAFYCLLLFALLVIVLQRKEV